MKKYNIGISVVLVLLSVLMIRSSLQSGAAVQGTAMGPGVWPMILGVAMILLSVVLIIQTLVRPRPEGEEKPIDFRSPRHEADLYPDRPAGLVAACCSNYSVFMWRSST